MSEERTFLLVRHGETTYNAEGRFQGERDIPLSEVGRAQARALRDRLTTAWEAYPPLLPGPPAACYASPLSRADETARILVEALPAPAEIRSIPLLRERSYGSWEGMTTGEIRSRFGPHATPDDAEPLETVRQRIEEAYERIRRETAELTDRGVVLVVGHGGSLRFFLSVALGLSADAVRRFQLDNTGLSVLTIRERDDGERDGRLVFWNDTAHLAPLGYLERPRATPPR
ncbi:MAG: histidine phosphatase family protein [Capsulimonadales bacterium]|nr:histidine phosphatase family protein [Capsulimonadales bacterium]